MIDENEFEENFAANYKNKLEELGINMVRLRAVGNKNKYRAVEFLTQPLDEEKVSLGFLRSQMISEKYNVQITVENWGRGETETDLKRSFSVEISEYSKDDNEKVMALIKKLKQAENDYREDKDD